jgi:PKD repeat protein
MNINIKTSFLGKAILLLTVIMFSSCDFEYDIAGTGSIEDLTLPSAAFTAIQNAGAGPDDWQSYNFGNASSSATTYSWDFGNGEVSTDFEPSTVYASEGSYTVTLTAQDNNEVISVISEVIQVSKPLIPIIADPELINSEFVKLAKSSGSDCACAGWINKSLGDQGESSSGNGSDALKFDNNEPDHVYQEFEVDANADYTIVVIGSFKGLENNTPPMDSMLELRVLAGSGYISDYTPTYYTDTASFPQDGFGYNSISSVEDDANNLLTKVVSNPSDTSYITYTYTFNAGNNTSVALFIRGIGGDSSGNFGYNSGDEEIRIDSVTITANN